MRLRISFFIAVLLTATSLLAQSSYQHDTAKWEVSPFVGYETHGSYPVDYTTSNSGNIPPTADRLRVDGAMSYGAMLDYSLNDNLQFEFLYARNPTTYSQHDYTVDAYYPIYDSTVNTFQWGVLAQFRTDQKLRPYIAGGLGFVHESNSDLTPNRTAFAYNLGGGVKYMISDHFGFRGDFRYLPTYGNSGQGTQCDYFGQCYQGTVRNYEKRTMMSGGLVFRF